MKRADVVGALVLALTAPVLGAAQSGPVEGVVRTDVGPVGGGVVYLQSEGPGGDTATSPSAAPPVIDQNHLRFLPSVVAVRTGTTVDFLNSDGILHNVFSPGWSGEDFDLGTYPSGTARSHTFGEPGPHVILCKVHPEMVAHVVVVTTPYFAVTDGEGRFRIGSVPPGRYRLTLWQRGQDLKHTEVVVPPGGVGGWTLDLSKPGRWVSSGAP